MISIVSSMQSRSSADTFARDLVAVCRFQARGTFPQSPFKRLIPLVREVTKLRVVFEINVGFSDTKCKTLTRIH
jgi:hypothetical protein